MIVSHSGKFIFVRPRKVATTSITAALVPFLHKGDLMSETLDELEDELGKPGHFERRDLGKFTATPRYRNCT